MVAHGGIIKAALIGLFDWKITMYHHFYVSNTAVSRVNFKKDGSPILVSFNDANHLTAETLRSV